MENNQVDPKASTHLEELYARKSELYTELIALGGKDRLSAEEEERWTKINQDFEACERECEDEEASVKRKARADFVKDQMERQAHQDKTEVAQNRAFNEKRLPQHTENETRAYALAGWLNFGNPEKDMALYRKMELAAHQVNLDLNQRQLKLNMFPDGPVNSRMPEATGGLDYSLSLWQKERRALSVGTATAGGHTVPEEMAEAIEVALLQFGAPRRYSTIIRTATGRTLDWPETNDTSNKGAIVGENTDVGEQDVAFAQTTFNSYMYTSKKVKVSLQLLQDSVVNISSLLGRLLGERIGRIHSDHFTTGTGSSQPNGIVTASADSGVTLGADNVPTYDNLIDLKHSVDPAYRQTGHGWCFSDTVLAGIKKIKDSDNNPIWRPGLAAGEPNTIDGDPYFINQSMSTAGTTGSKSMIYGQLNKYMIVDASEMMLKRLDEVAAESLQVVFLAHHRSTGNLVDAGTNPVKYAANP